MTASAASSCVLQQRGKAGPATRWIGRARRLVACAGFQTAGEADDPVRPNYDRLVEVKRRYGPGNLFRSNR